MMIVEMWAFGKKIAFDLGELIHVVVLLMLGVWLVRHW
jgi:hypothetical protein